MRAGLRALCPSRVMITANDQVAKYIAWIFMQYGA